MSELCISCNFSVGALIKKRAKRPTGETTQGETTQRETTHGRIDSRVKRLMGETTRDHSRIRIIYLFILKRFAKVQTKCRDMLLLSLYFHFFFFKLAKKIHIQCSFFIYPFIYVSVNLAKSCRSI